MSPIFLSNNIDLLRLVGKVAEEEPNSLVGFYLMTWRFVDDCRPPLEEAGANPD